MHSRRRAILLSSAATTAALAVLVLVLSADATPSATRRLFGLWRSHSVVLAGGLWLVAAGLSAAAASRQALLGYFAVCASMAASFALLETAGAVGLVSWSALLGPRASSALGAEAVPHLDVSGTTSQDTASAWGLPSSPIPFRYRTDRRGFRNDADRADADVYLIGDSVLVGALVPFEETVTARLEQAIRRSVMKVALVGKSPQEVQNLFRRAALPTQGRLVVQFVFEGNDLLDSRRFRTQGAQRKGARAWGDETLSLQLALTLQRMTQPVSGLAASRTCTIGEQTYTFAWTRDSFAGLDDEAAAIADSLVRFAAEIRQDGGEFAVVFVPYKLRVLGPFCRFPATSDLHDFMSHVSPLRDYLRGWSEREGIALLDLTDPLIEAARAGRIPWLWGDTHWNGEGHAVAAKALAAWPRLSGR